jgi:superfamily II DNA/RNA helicase
MKSDRRKIQQSKIVVGTPGRVLHLIRNEVFNTSCIQTVVLDESDKLTEKGHLGDDVLKILKSIPQKVQLIATTATVTNEMETSLKKLMKNPIGITPKQEAPVLLGIKQFVDEIPGSDENIKVMLAKIEELKRIFSRVPFKQCLLFTDSQMKTISYGNYLLKAGWQNEVINASLDQSKRMEVLEKLQKFTCRILITTDLMARGIDLENVNLIINLDLPSDCCTYLHRIGRAGRFGSYGISITFVSGEKEMEKFKEILGEIGGAEISVLKFPKDTIPNLWNFQCEHREEERKIFGEITGKLRKSEEESEEKVVKKNLALLEMSKLLVDVEEKPEFDMSDILLDYEKNCIFTELLKPEQNGKDDIDEASKEPTVPSDNLNGLLVNDDFIRSILNSKNITEHENGSIEKSPIESAGSESDLNGSDIEEKADEKICRKVIFVRQPDQSSDSGSLDSASNLDESDEESIQQIPQARKQNRTQIVHPQKMENGHPSYSWYNQYCAQSYEKWQNIYFYQLSSINNYLNFNNKN